MHKPSVSRQASGGYRRRNCHHLLPGFPPHARATGRQSASITNGSNSTILPQLGHGNSAPSTDSGTPHHVRQSGQPTPTKRTLESRQAVTTGGPKMRFTADRE